MHIISLQSASGLQLLSSLLCPSLYLHRRPSSTTPDFLNMTEDERVALLTRIYGGKASTPSTTRRPKLRLYNLPEYPAGDDDARRKVPPRTPPPPARPETAPPAILPRVPSSSSGRSTRSSLPGNLTKREPEQPTIIEFDGELELHPSRTDIQGRGSLCYLGLTHNNTGF